MSTFWSWLIQHWKALGITISIPTIIATIKWGCATYNAQRQERIDSRVLDALGNRDLWSRNRPFTGAGELFVRAREIADLLGLKVDIVADSLERLETQGKAQKSDGTASNPAPYWVVVRR